MRLFLILFALASTVQADEPTVQLTMPSQSMTPFRGSSVLTLVRVPAKPDDQPIMATLNTRGSAKVGVHYELRGAEAGIVEIPAGQRRADYLVIPTGAEWYKPWVMKFTLADVVGARADNKGPATCVIEAYNLPSVYPQASEEKKAAIKALVAQYSWTGAIIVTQADEIIVHEGKGGRGTDFSTTIASVSKQFTAAGIMRCIELGKISSPQESYGSTTLHKLMTHTRYGGYSYSNSGFQSLRSKINSVTGNANQFVWDELLVKAGMEDEASATYFSGDGGIRSTVYGMYLWHKAIRDEVVLSAESYAQMTQKHVSTGDGWWYGYGLRIGESSDGLRIEQHGGSYSGSISYYYRYPEKDAMFFVLSYGVSSTFISKLHTLMKMD